jgi:hypothetical protein
MFAFVSRFGYSNKVLKNGTVAMTRQIRRPNADHWKTGTGDAFPSAPRHHLTNPARRESKTWPVPAFRLATNADPWSGNCRHLNQ